MSADRELLEAAAKAAGLGNGPYDFDPRTGWNPIEDDGAALRLAVDLGMKTTIDGDVGAYVSAQDGDVAVMEPFEGDQHAATRRAIVRAAAALARG